MSKTTPSGAKVTLIKDGPIQVEGTLPMARVTIGVDSRGESEAWVHGDPVAAPDPCLLCRCGQSGEKPFCDGSHKRTRFHGTETASRETFKDQATFTEGPSMSLMDTESLCAFARFCDPHGQVWGQVHLTTRPGVRDQFIQQTCDCPSGRLVAVDNATGQPVEPFFEPSIRFIDDPAQGCAGPIWLRGGVQVVGADGYNYEVRNRVTLRRCGASKNKPFCDGTHAAIGFQD